MCITNRKELLTNDTKPRQINFVWRGFRVKSYLSRNLYLHKGAHAPTQCFRYFIQRDGHIEINT